MKLGVQCQEKHESVYQYNATVQPNSIKAINIVDADFWGRILNENPRLEYAIYRECPNGPDPFADPIGAAHSWVAHNQTKIQHLVDLGLITHVEGYNEWIHSFQTGQFEAADAFMEALIDEIHKVFGGEVHIIVLNASCGHFSDDILSFPRTLAKLNGCPECMLGMHEYDREDMDRLHRDGIARGDGGFWLCGKFFRVRQALEDAGYHNVRIALTEVGLDDAVDRPAGSHHWGWGHYGATLEEAVRHFLNDRNLAWYYPLLEGCEMVELASIFGCGMHYADNWGEWHFDIGHGFPALLEGIKNLEGVEPPSPPPDPPQEEPMIRVYDFEHGVGDPAGEKGLEWLRSIFGDFGIYPVTNVDPDIQPGDWYWRIKWLNCKRGDTACIIHTDDEDGYPIAGTKTVFHWPTAEPFVEQGLPILAHGWTDRGAVGPTNHNGDAGPSYGHGAYYAPDEGERGPHLVWIYDEGLPSEMIDGLGMIAGTYHDHFDIGFELAMYGGEDPSPPPPINPDLNEIIVALNQNADSAEQIADDLRAIAGMLPGVCEGNCESLKANIRPPLEQIDAIING